MHFSRHGITALLLAMTMTGVTHTASAQATWWSPQLGGNGHYYEAVLATGDGIDWTDAQADASARGGYLATPTSQAENDFIFSLIQDPSYWFEQSTGGLGPWLGGLQPDGSAEPLGGWQWLSGEPWRFTAWELGEPNNLNGDESRLQYLGLFALTGKLWNDQAEDDSRMQGYVVEYDQAPPLVDLGGAVSGAGPMPLLSASGAMAAGATLELTLTDGIPSGVAHLVLGLSSLNVPLWGGILVPAPDIIVIAIPLDELGTTSVQAPWPPGIPGGLEAWYQFWMPDPTAAQGWSASNGIKGTSL